MMLSLAATGQGKRAVRIDYVWTSAAVKLAQLSMVKARSGMSYSDHLALEVRFNSCCCQPDICEHFL